MNDRVWRLRIKRNKLILFVKLLNIYIYIHFIIIFIWELDLLLICKRAKSGTKAAFSSAFSRRIGMGERRGKKFEVKFENFQIIIIAIKQNWKLRLTRRWENGYFLFFLCLSAISVKKKKWQTLQREVGRGKCQWDSGSMKLQRNRTFHNKENGREATKKLNVNWKLSNETELELEQ